SPVMTALIGLAVGAVVALALSMVPSVVLSSPRPEIMSPPVTPVVPAAPAQEHDDVAATAPEGPSDLPADGVLVPQATDDGVDLTLLTDGPVDTWKTFWLDAPRRLVVDLPGRKSGFSSHTYMIQSGLASRLRTGVHPDKTRFVIE